MPGAEMKGGRFVNKNKSMTLHKETRRESLVAYAMILPTIVSFFIFLYIPFADAVRISFYKYTGLGGIGDFLGFGNYVRVLSDKLFFMSMGNTFQLMIIGILAVPIGFLLAYVLYTGIPGKKVFHIALFIPYLISMIVVGSIWRIIYDPIVGPLNQILKAASLDSFALAWLSRRDTALWAIGITWIWRSTPFNMLIMYANILKMPADFLEAADIDGANILQKLRYVIIPYLTPTFSVLIMLSVTNALRLFDLVWAMTQGGPGGATEVITSYIYRRSFVVQDFGTGTAASLILMIIMVAIMGGSSLFKSLRARRSTV